MLGITQFSNCVERTFRAHKHGCWKRGRNLKISAKKAVFLVSSGKKKFHHFWPPLEKLLEKSTGAPPRKIPSDVPTPIHTSM